MSRSEERKKRRQKIRENILFLDYLSEFNIKKMYSKLEPDLKITFCLDMEELKEGCNQELQLYYPGFNKILSTRVLYLIRNFQ